MGQVNLFCHSYIFYFLKSAQKLNNGTICLVVNKGRKIFQWIPKAGKGWVNWNLSAKNSTVAVCPRSAAKCNGVRSVTKGIPFQIKIV